MNQSICWILAGAIVGAGLTGCASSKLEPVIASSASQASYAEGYPAEVDAQTKGFSDREAELKTITSNMPRYPDELKAPVAAEVPSVYEGAHASGNSSAYVERMRESEHVQTFFDEEKDEISRKVAGSVDYTAKQKGCDASLGGVATYALKEAIEKQTKERMRERNEGQMLIDRNRVAIGKENAAVLEKQADDIAYASYLANVDLVERKARLERIADEAGKVRDTTEAFIEAERKFQADPRRTDAEKKASEQRIAAMAKSRDASEASGKKAEAAARGLEERIKALQKAHEEAFEKLSASARQKVTAGS